MFRLFGFLKQKDNIKQHIIIIKNIRLSLNKIYKKNKNQKEKQAINLCIKLCEKIESCWNKETILNSDIDNMIKENEKFLFSYLRNLNLLFSIMNKYIINW